MSMGTTYEVSLCNGASASSYYLNIYNGNYSIKDPAGTVTDLQAYQRFNFTTEGMYELTNTVTLDKKNINVVPGQFAFVNSVELMDYNLRNDTLYYCKKSDVFSPDVYLNIGYTTSSCPSMLRGLSDYGAQMYVNGQMKNHLVERRNDYYRGYFLNTDSLKTGDQIRFQLFGFGPQDICTPCYQMNNDLQTKAFTLKILDNPTLPVPTIGAATICPGDTAIFTRSKTTKKVFWQNTANDTSYVLKTLNPLLTALESVELQANGCKALSKQVQIEGKNCGYKLIRGYVYEDLNKNYKYDKEDRVFPNVKVQLNGHATFTFSDANGLFQFKSDTFNLNKAYGVKIADLDYYEVATNASYFSSNHYYLDQSLPTFKLRNSDLALGAISSRSRPGFTVPLYFTIVNQGKKTNSGALTVTLDNAYTFASSSPAQKSVNGKTVVIDVDSLKSSASRTITVYATLGVSTVLGNIVTTSASLTTKVADDLTANNSLQLTSVVTGSFDPNDIEVTPKGIGASGTIADTAQLKYTIRFQNTGTDTAFTVVVKDKIPEGLDFSKFQMLGASHPYVLTMQGKDTIVWTFPNILLPDNKINEPKSHGSIVYKIEQKAKNPTGTEIRNHAEIYFDFNAPIVTNQVTNTVGILPNGWKTEAASHGLVFFPNPVEQLLNVHTVVPGKLTFQNALGEVLMQSWVEEEEKLDLSVLPKGLYFWNFQTADQESTGKIMLK